MKYNLEKYINYYVYLGFSLIFSILVLIATRGEAPYASTAFTLGSFQVQWYAVFILTGIVFAVMLSYLEIKRVKMDPEILWDGLLIFIPFSIVSARLWYVLFNLDRYQNDWGRIFNLTEGGLGIHGAVIGTFIALIWFTRRKKISYWFLLDIVAPGFLIGQTLGRWGNFMNRELYGPIADNLNWLPSFIKDQMFIQGAYRHPTFLYESLWNLTGLILILVLRKKRLFKLGDILAGYLVWYGIGRIPTETLRLMSGVDEPLMAFGIPVSITTSILFILAGLTILILKRIYRKDIGYYIDYGQRAVLFDLDGTLLDTKELIFDNIKKTFKHFFPEIVLSEEALASFMGPTLNESFSWYERDPKRIDEMIDYYRTVNEQNHHQKVKAFDQALETLKDIKDKGYFIGVVSSKKHDMVKLGLAQTKLLPYVDVIVGYDDVKQHKPHPESLLKALSELGVHSEHAYYVGDHPNDIAAAKQAKIIPIGVSYSLHVDKVLAEQPHAMIDNLEKLSYLL